MIWLENSADEAASQRQEIQVPTWELPEGMQDHIQELVSQYQPPSFADGDDTVGISCYRLLCAAISKFLSSL